MPPVVPAILPPMPTPDLVASFIQAKATEVIQAMSEAASAAQLATDAAASDAMNRINTAVSTVGTAARDAGNDLQRRAGQAKSEMDAALQRSIADLQQLLSEALRVIGRLPSPTDLAIGDINGDLFYDPITFNIALLRAIGENKPTIKIRFHEPNVAQAFRDLVGTTMEDISRKAREKFIPRIPTAGLVEPVSGTAAAGGIAAVLAVIPPAVWIILAIAMLVLAIGATIFVVLMGVAIIFALYRGYNIQNTRFEFTTPLGGATFGADFSK